MTDESCPSDEGEFHPQEVTRPASVLLWYYALCSLLLGPLFPFAFIPLFCKYVTLRYRFDDSGIAMQWGVLFRREIYLTYRRIQDIHLTRNLIQRWFGIATVAVQTASGSATPEMSIEGVLQGHQILAGLERIQSRLFGLDLFLGVVGRFVPVSRSLEHAGVMSPDIGVVAGRVEHERTVCSTTSPNSATDASANAAVRGRGGTRTISPARPQGRGGRRGAS